MHDNTNDTAVPSEEAIAAIMAELATGRGTSVFDLAEIARVPLERLVRGTLVRYGRRRAAADPDEIDFLVMTAAMVIFDRASGWMPGGSPPWVWARHAIRSAVAAHIGHATSGDDPCDLAGGGATRSPAGSDPMGDRTLADLVDVDERFRLLVEALDLVASPRDRRVVLDFIDQKSAGDPSPSHTVAELVGLSPANVRKIHSRVRGRVLLLVQDDERFEPLARGEWLVVRPRQEPCSGGDDGRVVDGRVLDGAVGVVNAESVARVAAAPETGGLAA